MHPSLLPILLFMLCAGALAGLMLVIARLFNPSRPRSVKEMPYESGMDPIHDTRRRFTVRFHLVAIAFLLFDVEILFLYPWAVSLRPAPTVAASAPAAAEAPRGIDAAVAAGWIDCRTTAFWGAMVFIVLLMLGFLYDWRKGVFDWR